MKSVLISIQPKWIDKIIKGEKTIEVRKTRPKIEIPFKCYIYCTKHKERLTEVVYKEDTAGKVVGEFVCNNIEEFESEFWDYETYESIAFVSYDEDYGDREIDIFAEDGEDNALCKSACLTWNELKNYIGQGIKTFYGWHITDLKIYDKPIELSDFYKREKWNLSF